MAWILFQSSETQPEPPLRQPDSEWVGNCSGKKFGSTNRRVTKYWSSPTMSWTYELLMEVVRELTEWCEKRTTPHHPMVTFFSFPGLHHRFALLQPCDFHECVLAIPCAQGHPRPRRRSLDFHKTATRDSKVIEDNANAPIPRQFFEYRFK